MSVSLACGSGGSAPAEPTPTQPPAAETSTPSPSPSPSPIPTVPPPPTSTPEPECPAPLSWDQDEKLKIRIENEFGIIIGDPREAGSEYWPSVQIQIIYNALSRINDVLGGNLKSSWLGGYSVLFYKFKNSLGDGKYYGIAHDVEKINFYIVDTFPYHLIYHEMGHILNNAQGQRFTNSLSHTAVYTGYPNQTGARIMGGTPYNRIDGQGYISPRLQDPCGASVKAELHPASEDGNNAGEEWGDLFANYVSGNFNSLPEGQAKYRWVQDQLFGS
jgi:hypothetical protein